jgi:hypothetical protein
LAHSWLLGELFYRDSSAEELFEHEVAMMRTNEEISRLSNKLAEDSSSADVREAARITGGVPAHIDMTGILVVLTEGKVAFFDTETRTVRDVEDDSWRTIARVSAAKKYPELQPLVPERPPDAQTCVECEGSGMVMGMAICGNCYGLGWIRQ